MVQPSKKEATMTAPRENRYEDKDVDELREKLEDAAKNDDWESFQDTLDGDDDDD